MKNINKVETKKAVIFDNGEQTLTLIQNVTVAKVILDENEFGKDNVLEGLVTFVEVDAIEVEDYGVIDLEYVKEIELA